MYSGTTFRKNSGGFIGVHQKIDRVARRHLSHMPGAPLSFPSTREILHFEGNNGPDGIKRKSPSIDEPWHYVDPLMKDDTSLRTMILDHHVNMVEALKNDNRERVAFEAAWIAHAIADGLTPAHHYPLSEKIEELWGRPKEERLTIIEKNLIRGKSNRETVRKNWQYWGAKGIFTTHVLFELGIATAIKTSRLNNSLPSSEWLAHAEDIGVGALFDESVQRIYALDMYKEFWQNGWTAKLARESRQILIPEIIQVVLFAWYSACKEADR